MQRTRYVGDYGADLIVNKAGVKTVVQAKRYGKAVGIKAVQEAVAAKGMYGCTEAMVVTNSTYTRAAIDLARANRVSLWDRDCLVKTILRAGAETGTLLSAPQMPAPEPPFPKPSASAAPNCATCGVQVSEKVQQFCLGHSERFSGKVYCFEHQKAIRRNAV